MNWKARLKTVVARHYLINEFCHDCGAEQPVVWTASDSLWAAVMGGPAGVVCPTCFDKRCSAHGFQLRWVPYIEFGAQQAES